MHQFHGKLMGGDAVVIALIWRLQLSDPSFPGMIALLLMSGSYLGSRPLHYSSKQFLVLVFPDHTFFSIF